MTYLLLNLVFIGLLARVALKYRHKPSKVWWLTLAAVVALTAVFDPIIIALDIVDYTPQMTLGIKWFGAPIEDFFYAILAVGLVPLVWHILEKRGPR
jgi:lycopene cyclase domain-containing protein